MYETAIGGAPIAIAWVYSKLNVSQVRAFVNKYSYSNVTVAANYLSNYSVHGLNFTDVWLVNYTAPLANHTVTVVLSQLNKTAELVFNTTKS